MSFPKDVAERALVDSGRHCCLCHKFCGSKIVLHHIIQKEDGGEDTYENCIPLCFDCHAEIKAYNHKYPNGMAYSESELKKHRDNWYLKVKASGGIVANEDHLELDQKVFLEIQRILKSDEVMEFIRDNNFAGFAFRYSRLEPINEFYHLCQKPEFEFLDVDLEGLRSKLYKLIENFRKEIAFNTFPVNSEMVSVPPEWAFEQPERFNKVVDTIHELTGQIWDTYSDLIKLGRRKLGI
ncbi:MAG TPA: HNH endonuclease [Peptococcaceae bacterium]|nr:HNH endonuclease [Peptococcaceae bacterium]